MSSLQPVHALNLDQSQQENFVKYFNSLPEKPPTTVRIFDRNDYYSVHGDDATTAAREIFSVAMKIKKMGTEPNLLEYVVLNNVNFENLIKKLLLLRRYRIEIYVAEGPVKNNQWELKYKASPGSVSQLEEVLKEDSRILEKQLPCLMAVSVKTDAVSKGRLLGVACLTAGDYQISVAEFTDDDLLTKLETITVQMGPSECLLPKTENDDYKAVKKVMERTNVVVTKLKNSDFSKEGLFQDLNRLLKFTDNQQQNANVFPETNKNVAMASLAASIKYTSLLSDETNFGRFRLTTIDANCFLHLDAAALNALNVLPDPRDTIHSNYRSLFGLLDRCRTQQGRRLLAQWLRQPLRDINLINERLDIVELLVDNSQLRLQLHDNHLRMIPDLQALTRRLTRKKANLHDVYRIYQAVKRLPHIARCLSGAEHPTVQSSLVEPILELSDDLAQFRSMVDQTIDTDAIEKGNYLVKSSFDNNLQNLIDEMNRLDQSAEDELRYAAQELELEAGKSIKLENNPQYGFHFRVMMRSEKLLRNNPNFVLVDTVKGGVRFKTDKLLDLSEEYNQAKAEYEKIQGKIVSEIIKTTASYSDCLFCASHILSRLDVLVAFSVAASTAPYPYYRPIVTEDTQEFILKDVRHPCMEVQEGVSFIPNDVVFKRDSCIMHIVTGANMGGKSTWMRSCGLAALMAHAGCLVPATEAKIPLLKALCARVGASDKEVKGQSTFMVEMVETATILRMASPDSLVLIDELGRGTSTFDGCGIAWAVAEELATKLKCFCLFATHYHELTRLANMYPGIIVNSHAEASLVDDQLLLLHKIAPGPATNSLGLAIAKLADLPESVIKDAEARQAELGGNTVEIENRVDPQEVAEGQIMIKEFLKKCKEITKKTKSDEELMKQIDELKQDFRSQNNRYVQELLASFV